MTPRVAFAVGEILEHRLAPLTRRLGQGARSFGGRLRDAVRELEAELALRGLAILPTPPPPPPDPWLSGPEPREWR